MNRRDFIGCLAALSASQPAGAQPARKIARIGIITSGFTTAELKGPDPKSANVAAFLRGMRELGYEYGKEFVTEPRGGEGRTEVYPLLAAELVRLLDRVSDDQREVLVLRFVLDMPLARVAGICGKSETAVTALQFRGLQRLRREVER